MSDPKPGRAVTETGVQQRLEVAKAKSLNQVLLWLGGIVVASTSVSLAVSKLEVGAHENKSAHDGAVERFETKDAHDGDLKELRAQHSADVRVLMSELDHLRTGQKQILDAVGATPRSGDDGN